MDGPLALFYSLESILLALSVAGLTQIVKGTIPRGPKVDRIVLPMIPILLGAVLAVVVPIRPTVLVAWAGVHKHGWTVYALWGIAIGQFADYLYQRVKRVLDATPVVPPTTPATPPAADPQEPVADPAPASDLPARPGIEDGE